VGQVLATLFDREHFLSRDVNYISVPIYVWSARRYVRTRELDSLFTLAYHIPQNSVVAMNRRAQSAAIAAAREEDGMMKRPIPHV
jgi:hypothetical protein